jgi:hypothetical protein
MQHFHLAEKNVMDDKVDDKAPQWHGQHVTHGVTHSERQVCNFVAYGIGLCYSIVQHIMVDVYKTKMFVPSGCLMHWLTRKWQEWRPV